MASVESTPIATPKPENDNESDENPVLLYHPGKILSPPVDSVASFWVLPVQEIKNAKSAKVKDRDNSDFI